ncbi:hypothetical protein B296_00053213 [Ensete ventricosum]|uniref:Uncharacterized protein n=1 Tax=Ensete ventricosum TaxID=4639 RepID=A0A426XAF9_ENSVE|nr:hypothetical protein B296_00053213 [Ensete ventricosum]
MDLNVLRKKPRMPGGKGAPVASREGAQPEVEVTHAEASGKRLTGSPVPDQTVADQPGKRVKIAMRKHKAYRGEGSSRRAARERESGVSTEDSSSTYCRPKSMRDLCDMRVWEDDEVGELEVDNAKLKSGLDELSSRLDEADKELNELREGLAESQRQLKEQKANCRKADNKLLKLMRENESLKAELLGKSIANYKQSVGFRWGLWRMGQVSYESGYRVALARF